MADKETFDLEKERNRFVAPEEMTEEEKGMRLNVWQTFTAYATALLEDFTGEDGAEDVQEQQKQKKKTMSKKQIKHYKNSMRVRRRRLEKDLRREMRALKQTMRKRTVSDASSYGSSDSESSLSDDDSDDDEDDRKRGKVKNDRQRSVAGGVPNFLIRKQNSFISNIPNKLDRHLVRRIVSQNRRRYVDKENGFDLDLVYVTPQLIAMAHPSSGLEMIYRNNYNSVMKFLDLKHKGHYKIYNLCMKRKYRLTVGGAHYGFLDHNACPLRRLTQLLDDIDAFLKLDDKNVAGIHCKAGKGRTGLTISCYLLRSGVCADAQDAIEFFGEKRTTNGHGVTIPSQKRYVQYYHTALLNDALMRRIKLPRLHSPLLKLKSIAFYPIPKLMKNNSAALFVKVAVGTERGLENVVRTDTALFRVVKIFDHKGKSQRALMWDSEYKPTKPKTRGLHVAAAMRPMSVAMKPMSSIFDADPKDEPLVTGAIPVQGDFRLGLYYTPKRAMIKRPMSGHQRIAHCWLNTNYIPLHKGEEDEDQAWTIPLSTLASEHADYTGSLTLHKSEIDGKPRKDTKNKRFAKNFTMRLKFGVDAVQPDNSVVET